MPEAPCNRTRASRGRVGTLTDARRHAGVLTLSQMNAGTRSAVFPSVPGFTGMASAAPDLAAEARRIHAESVVYWDAYAADAFWRRPTRDVWAPVDQVRHLTKSIRAVNQGLALPRPLLALFFGLARGGTRSFPALRERYAEVLANGGSAGGYAPRALSPADATEEKRASIMAEHAAVVARFAAAIERWPERALDRYQLPHPLLGKLTVREMAQFTLLHNVHHVAVAERRRRSFAWDSGP